MPASALPHLRGRGLRDPGGGIGRVGKPALHVGQEEDLEGAERRGHGARRGVGVHVVGAALGVRADGSIDLGFGPDPPTDSGSHAKNWIQTTPGKGWFTLFRFYGPLEPFFDQTWKPDDIAKVK